MAHTCAILNDGRVMCWGLNNHGQLGISNVVEALKPSLVVSGIPAAKGGLIFTKYFFSIISDIRDFCFLFNNIALRFLVGSSVLIPICEHAGVSQLSAGSFHTCALLNDSSIMCWGANGDGQLGIENNWTDTAIPHVVDLGQGFHLHL